MKLSVLFILIFAFPAVASPPSWHSARIKDLCSQCIDCCMVGKVKRVPFSKFDTSLLEVARTNCKNARPDKVDVELLKDLLSVEKKIGVPEAYRGAVLAAACRESGYKTTVKGDGGKAVGLLQMWPWWKSRFKLNRLDPIASARAWISQILRTVSKATRKCGKRHAFVRAWAWVASGPKGWRCRAPRHYSTLKRWHVLVRKDLSRMAVR